MQHRITIATVLDQEACTQKKVHYDNIRHFGKHILKHDKVHNLAIIEYQTYQLHKWLEDDDITRRKLVHYNRLLRLGHCDSC